MIYEFIVAIKTGRKAPSVEGILIPGGPEWRTRKRRLRHSIDLPDAAWKCVVEAGASCGVEVVP
jgi:LDH2 family malate/lactate/ureidoglycolate dehydrogenase